MKSAGRSRGQSRHRAVPGFLAALLAKIDARVEVSVSRAGCKKTINSQTINETPEQCYESKIRFVDWEISVKGRHIQFCKMHIWRNISTGERELFDSAEQKIFQIGSAKKVSAGGYQRAPKRCDGYVTPPNDPHDGITSMPCCAPLAGCHDFQSPPASCCGLWMPD